MNYLFKLPPDCFKKEVFLIGCPPPFFPSSKSANFTGFVNIYFILRKCVYLYQTPTTTAISSISSLHQTLSCTTLISGFAIFFWRHQAYLIWIQTTNTSLMHSSFSKLYCNYLSAQFFWFSRNHDSFLAS